MIYLAPLQGFTDFVYRKVYAEIFPGIGKFFTPYIAMKNDSLIKKYFKEVVPENNRQGKIVPQVLVKDEKEVLHLVRLLKDLGYQEVNLNLGCPYPMVTNRGKGAGLLPFPEKVDRILSAFFDSFELDLSVKLRVGLEKPQEIESIIPVLNQYNLKEVIVHPRIAKQLYKGEIHSDSMDFVIKNLKHKVIYNGDIFSVTDFIGKQERFRKINDWMLGRGVLMNPFLPSEIIGRQFSDSEKLCMLQEFHHRIFTEYQSVMDNNGNVLNKMQQFWSYFSYSFPEQKKVFKAIKKSRNMQQYKAKVQEFLS